MASALPGLKYSCLRSHKLRNIEKPYPFRPVATRPCSTAAAVKSTTGWQEKRTRYADMADTDDTVRGQAPLGTENQHVKKPTALATEHDNGTGKGTTTEQLEHAAEQQQEEQASEKQFTPRKLLLILHGKRIHDDQIRDAIQQLKEEGHEVVVRVTWDSGDVDQFVKEAVELWDQQHYDTLVAGGGDGTLNELVAALLKHNAPAGISIAQLPLGTANDLASATGISLAPLDALHLALDPSTVHPVDVALVNGEVFMNLATAGPVSEVSSKHMSDAMKKMLGPAAVAVAGFQQLFITGLKPIKNVTLTFPKSADTKLATHQPDEVSHLSGDLLVLAAGQSRQMGRMINVCPDALLDDGLLDFTLLFGSPGRTVAALASDVLSSGLSQAQGGVQLLRLPWCIVEAAEDLKCNRDGEPSPPSKKLVFEVLPRRIHLHLPDARLLLEGQGDEATRTTAAAAAGLGKGDRKAWWKRSRRKGFRTGTKPRRRLLLDLWAAQQPPGRLSRMLPGLRHALGKALWYGCLIAAGFAVGFNAQQLMSGNNPAEESTVDRRL